MASRVTRPTCRRALAAGLCLVGLCPPARAWAGAPSRIVFEAEEATSVTGTWELRGNDECGGKAMLYSGEGTGRNIGYDYRAPAYGFLGRAHYDIDVPGEGAYVLWGRCWSGDQCSNSCWVGFDDRAPVYFPEGRKGAEGYVWSTDRYRRWLWLRLPDVHLGAGRHRMRVEVREDGFMIDQWALLPGTDRQPEGVLDPTTTTLGPEAPWLRAYPHSHLIHAGGRDVVSVWLRRGDVDLAGDLDVRVPAGVARVPETARLRTEGRALARADVVLDHPADFPRGEHEYLFTFTPDDGRPLTAAVRLSRPFAWRVLAPISLSAGATTVVRVGRSQDVVPDTPDPAYWPGDDTPAHGVEGLVRWREVDDIDRWFTPYGFLDFRRAFGTTAEAKAFARTTVHAPDDGEYLFEILSDDESCLWIDGVLVYVNRHARPATDVYACARARLKRGGNDLAFAVRQRTGNWQLRVRIRALDGGISNVR